MYNSDNHKVKITTHDRLMRAWENSMELTRDFELYSKEIDDDKIRKTFSDFAVEEGIHASTFREMLMDNQNNAV